jgi:putative transposase
MSLIALRPENACVIAKHSTTEWERLPQSQRKKALMIERFLQQILNDIINGTRIAVSVELMLARINACVASDELCVLAAQLGRNGKPPSRATIFRWVNSYQMQGVVGVVSKRTGRQRKAYGWEARALYWYQMPSKLAMAAVADLLVQEGFANATESRVTHYLKSLPHDVLNKKRVGHKTYRDAHMPFNRRDTSVLPVGCIYQGDGHTIDAYLAHPLTGKPWRPELTTWIDIASRYIAGWYISLSESSISTLFSLSHALLLHDHVPAMLHIDNGSGFRSKMMNDESTGFYSRFNMQTMFSIPGNAKGKGQIERFHRTIRDRYDKTLESYCGDDMSGDVLRKLLIDVNRGVKKLPTLDTYMHGFANFITAYHNKVHSALNGQTPAQLWAALQRTPVVVKHDAIVRPRIQRKVTRGTLTLFSREYRHAELIRYNTETLLIEYNLHDDSAVRVLTDDERFICDAALTQRMPYVAESRIADMQQNRLKGQLKRLEKHADEVRERARMNIDHEAYVATLDTGDIPLALPQAEYNLVDDLLHDVPDSADVITLDITDTDY